MKEFFRELFTWKGRWNRLKFWLYPLALLIPTLIVLTIISFISLSGYSDQAKEVKVNYDLSTISSTISVNSLKGIDINSFKNDDNSINYDILKADKEYFKNPFSDSFGEYKIFIKDGEFQVYGETPNEIIIKGNYYKEDDSQPESLVIIDGETKIQGIKKGINSNNNSNYINRIGPILILIFYLLMLYISYVAYIKRLRDLDKSPWMSLLLLIPFANIYLWIICAFFKGTVGPNKYGADPLNGNIKESKTIEL